MGSARPVPLPLRASSLNSDTKSPTKGPSESSGLPGDPPHPCPLSPDGGEGRVTCNLLLPLPWGEGGRRPGEGVAADGARVFSVDGVVRCIIWVLRSRDALVTTRTELIPHVRGSVSTIRVIDKASSMSSL